MPVSRCLYCGRLLARSRTPRAEYCGDVCRAGAFKLRQQLARLPSSIEFLYTAFRQHAPPRAIGYRLLYAQGARIWQYPAGDGREWRDYRGTRCTRRSFALWPFEIPIVPISATYGVHFIGRGAVWEPPAELLIGFAVHALRDGMQVEEGGEL